MDEIDVSSTANLYKSLAKTAPEIKECVDACNFIAESTKQQNDIGSVSVCILSAVISTHTLFFLLHLVFLMLSLFFSQEMESWVLIGKMIDKVCFWAAILLFSVGTVAIFLMGHYNQAPEYPFPWENKKYLPE